MPLPLIHSCSQSVFLRHVKVHLEDALLEGVKSPLTHQYFSYMSQFVWGIHSKKGVKNPLTHCDEYFKYLGSKS